MFHKLLRAGWGQQGVQCHTSHITRHAVTPVAGAGASPGCLHNTQHSLSPPSVGLHHLHLWDLHRVIACDSCILCPCSCLHHRDSCDFWLGFDGLCAEGLCTVVWVSLLWGEKQHLHRAMCDFMRLFRRKYDVTDVSISAVSRYYTSEEFWFVQFAYKITLVIVRYFQFVHEFSYKIKFQVCQVKPYKPNKDFFMEKCCEGWTVLHGVWWAAVLV